MLGLIGNPWLLNAEWESDIITKKTYQSEPEELERSSFYSWRGGSDSFLTTGRKDFDYISWIEAINRPSLKLRKWRLGQFYFAPRPPLLRPHEPLAFGGLADTTTPGDIGVTRRTMQWWPQGGGASKAGERAKQFSWIRLCRQSRRRNEICLNSSFQWKISLGETRQIQAARDREGPLSLKYGNTFTLEAGRHRYHLPTTPWHSSLNGHTFSTLTPVISLRHGPRDWWGPDPYIYFKIVAQAYIFDDGIWDFYRKGIGTQNSRGSHLVTSRINLRR